MTEPPAAPDTIPGAMAGLADDADFIQMEGSQSLSRSSSQGGNASSTSTHDGIDLFANGSGLPLADMLETFWDSRVDLIDRKWKTFQEEVKVRARLRRNKLLQKAKNQAEAKALKEEARKFRRGIARRVDRLVTRWNDAKVVRLRDKISYVVGVMNLVVSSLVFALRPDWMPLLYTIQCGYFLPLRIYSYARKQWHYFLFDFCYFLNTANLVFLWLMPQSAFLFTVCYCAAHGPLAWSVLTWRNSMVFHSLEKMTSLFIHLYPPIVFHTLRHGMDPAVSFKKYPALAKVQNLDSPTAFGFSIIMYAVWQALYYYFVAAAKKDKIASGERINSYSTMSSGKGAVAGLLGKAKPARREYAFMLLQFVYTIITMLPAPLLFYRSKEAASVFLLLIVTVSVINGASYYVEVWGRRFEKELIALRKEIEEARAAEQAASSELEDGPDGSRRSDAESALEDEDADTKKDQ